MIIRIVRMHFNEDGAQRFLKIFEDHKVAIRNVPGCVHLELLRDINHPFTFTTLSHWNAAGDLEKYRDSELFKTVWSQVKVLFSGTPQAFSLEKIIDV